MFKKKYKKEELKRYKKNTKKNKYWHENQNNKELKIKLNII